eukprot:1828687-Pleurochrysis_carterae.AAC.1
MMCPGYDELRNVCSSLVTHFSIALPDSLSAYVPPSLSLLARHYVDSVEEMQQAARSLMEGSMHRMSPELRGQVVRAWAPRVLRLGAVSGAVPELTSPHGVSVLVLAVLVCRFAVPLDAAVSAVLVRQLLALLDHPAELHRTAAAELLGKGFPTWREHLPSSAEFIRKLFRLSAAHAHGAAAVTAPPAAPAAAPPLVSSSSSSSFSTCAPPLGATGTSSSSVSVDEGVAAPNRFLSALLSTALVEPRAFCRVMGEEAVAMESHGALRVSAVGALISLVKMRSASLEPELPLLVEAVMRPLDPSVPSLREGSLAASTAALRELVKRYPMMSFNQTTQRLAVGTVEGVVLLYDLRTATKWRILQAKRRARHARTCAPHAPRAP